MKREGGEKEDANEASEEERNGAGVGGVGEKAVGVEVRCEWCEWCEWMSDG